MGQLAQALVRCGTLDVYFTQGESLQQSNLPPFKSVDYIDIAPEQLFILARMKDCSSLTHDLSSEKLQTSGP
jgi:hypothetical protein